MNKDKYTIKPQPQAAGYFSVTIELLRDRLEFMEQIRQGVRIPNKIIALLVSSSIFFAIYGAIIGSFHSPYQAFSAAVKLPALYLLTAIICLPTLYIFNTLFGSSRTIGQHFVLLLSAVGIISVLLFSLAPVTLFFVVTNPHYQFFKLLNVTIFALTGFVGTKFLYQGMQLISEEDTERQESRRKILRLWLVLYAFVGSQLAWIIRPFFGSPGTAFELVREMKGNFYLDIVKAIGEILGWH